MTTEPTDDVQPPPRGTRSMALVRWFLVASMALIAALSVLYSFGVIETHTANAASTKYTCPMHPEIVQDKPGQCPICNMDLVPTREPAKPKPQPKHAPHPTASAPLPPVPGLVPVELGLDRVQLIGVKTAVASSRELISELTTVGYVATDEAKTARVHARFSGWVERLAVATTGTKVRRGQVLLGLYNLELLPLEQEFLSARRIAANDKTKLEGSLAEGLERDARARLELFGLSTAEIDAIAASGSPARTLSVTAPISGHVVEKNVVAGAYVEPGIELFEIADLSKVWVLAEVYEHDAGRVRLGQAASVTVAAHGDRRFSGKLGFIYPTVDPGARTLRVRIELENKDLLLRPGMYGQVSIALDAATGVVIPREALVDTGEHQYVFVAHEGGHFEPRRVRPGMRAGDDVVILEGVAAGDTVVTSSNFLIDSESRLRAAVSNPGVSNPTAPHAGH